jgi:hypothetical protein
MLIYKLLGDSAQQELARSFGISYGLLAASEWQARAARASLFCSGDGGGKCDVLALWPKRRGSHVVGAHAPHARAPAPRCSQPIVIEALKGVLVLALMERLLLTRPSHWLEVRTRLLRRQRQPRPARPSPSSGRVARPRLRLLRHPPSISARRGRPAWIISPSKR